MNKHDRYCDCNRCDNVKMKRQERDKTIIKNKRLERQHRQAIQNEQDYYEWECNNNL